MPARRGVGGAPDFDGRTMSHFCLLQDPEGYVAHDWDMVADPALRAYWIGRFREHFEELARHALQRYGRAAERQINAVRGEFFARLDQWEADPASAPGGVLNEITLGRCRQSLLREHNVHDPYQRVKEQDNAAAVSLYPQTVRKLHAMESDRRWLHLIEGVFAGNVFDLGIPANHRTAEAGGGFLGALEAVKPRPWLIDDFDRLAADLEPAPPTKWARAVVFVDNAGSDFVLGLMPLVRELALEGTQIVLAANEHPVLNDLTADETVDVVEQLAAIDPELAALIEAEMFEVVSTGNDIALLDLADVSDELNEAAADADLILLEGMGRAAESNLDAAFSVDTLHLAILKDAYVARRVGGELLDCICKYTPVQA